MIVVNNVHTGNVALWLCGGGTAVQLGQSLASGGNGGTIGPTGTGYQWTNDTANNQITASFGLIRTRAYQ
jgi:hypothetical protein